MTPKKDKKIIVLLSGGIDSAVAAALLHKQGYDLTGVFMIFGKHGSYLRQDNKCCSIEAQESARRVAARLDIPFYTMNVSKEFKEKVIQYFVSEYKEGRTPNPCVMCNKFIKFGVMLNKALALGFDYVATGHYITKLKVKSEKLKVFYKLFQAKDKTRDQSYFLYTLTQDKLKHLLFPIGDYKKDEVKEIARRFNLPVLGRKESRGICFIGDETVVDFLKRHIKAEPGEIIDVNTKEVIGKHQGLPFYTIGQRERIGIGGTGPYYVIKLDFKENKLWVTSKPEDPALFNKELKVKDINWVPGAAPSFPLDCKVKIRYGHSAKSAILKRVKSEVKAQFQRPQRAVTPGQAAVFYSGQELLGGGIISE